MVNSKNDFTNEILILGLGNLLMSDDAIGLHVIKKLLEIPLPPEVCLLEIGTSVMYYLQEISHSHYVIAVDALRGGGMPGNLYCLGEKDIPLHPTGWRDMHGFSLLETAQLARHLTGLPRQIIIYGIEPQNLEPGPCISPLLEKSIATAVDAVVKKIQAILDQKKHP